MRGRMRVEKFLLICFVGIVVGMVIYMKFLGATDVGIDVEKNGYCKQFGEDWKNIRETNTCRNRYYLSQDIPNIEFTEEEFRNHCVKNTLFSTKFNSNCFHKSGSIS